MRKLVIISIAALFAATPAIAQDQKEDSKNSVWEQHSDLLGQEGQNREPGEDGTFQGKPVVKGPADYSSANADARSDSASTGQSAGESGTDR